MIQNQLKTWRNGTQERSERDLGTRSVPRAAVWRTRLIFWPILRPSKSKWAPETTRKIQYGDFLVPLGGQKANKNNVLVGVWKYMKCWWEIDVKIEGFWWLGSTFGVILFAYFTLSPFSKNIEILMKKWSQNDAKSMPKSSKIDFRRPRGRQMSI